MTFLQFFLLAIFTIEFETIFYSSIIKACCISLAGLSATITYIATSLGTTAFARITAPLPIFAPGIMVTFYPIHVLLLVIISLSYTADR